ncbi:universal stress protein [Planosporangium sp. 12N6]|uniref:universal stress protein n=1 Tax=Planosporangium spinosum TaxID=3402278 RepID=UPI003CF88643
MTEPLDTSRSAHSPARVDGPSLVVVGVDASPSAWRAFAWACGHARRSRCPLLAIFASGPSYLEVLAADPSAAEAREAAAAEVAADISTQVQHAAENLGVAVRFEHHHGDPASVLLTIARDRAADLLVLGASAQGVHRIAGGLPGKLVRCRRLPVVVIP